MNFNNVAKDYEKFSITQNDASKRLLNLIGDNKYNNILDVGCASGVNTNMLLNYLQDDGKYYGIDPSKEMIELAKEKHKDIYNFICSTYENFETLNKYDLIFCNSVFYFFKNKQVFFDQSNNILSSDGTIAIQAQTRLCKLFYEAIENVKSCDSLKHQMEDFVFPANLISEKEFLNILSQQNYFSV